MRRVLYPRARRDPPRSGVSAGLGTPAFGASPDFALGLEDELLIVDPGTHALSHTAVELLRRLDVPPAEGTAKPDTYAAMVELTAPVSAHAGEATRAIGALRGRVRAAGAPVLGALASNSPFWFGTDSGLASARSSLFRAYRGADLPRAFDGYDDYAETIEQVVAAGGLPDYTFLWW